MRPVEATEAEEVSPQDLADAQAEARRLGIPARYAVNLLPLLRKPSDFPLAKPSEAEGTGPS